PVVRERHGDSALFKHVDRCLEVGGAVAIFPEANYGPAEGELLPFHKGFAHFAIKAGVPVVPVALSGTKDLWLRKKIRVVVGPAGWAAASWPAGAARPCCRCRICPSWRRSATTSPPPTWPRSAPASAPRPRSWRSCSRSSAGRRRPRETRPRPR